MSEVIDIHMASDLSEWTGAVSDGCAWSASAAMCGGGGGLLVTIDDTTATYEYKTISNNTSGILRYRFYIDPNSLTMASGDYFWAFASVSSAPNFICVTTLRLAAGVRYIGGIIYVDGSTQDLLAATVTDAQHCVEVYVTRAATNVSSDGTVTYWVDDVQIDAKTGLDNYDQFSNFATIRAGAVAGVDAGTSGTFFIDEIVVNDDGGKIGTLDLSINVAGNNATYQNKGVKVRAA